MQLRRNRHAARRRLLRLADPLRFEKLFRAGEVERGRRLVVVVRLRLAEQPEDFGEGVAGGD
jgi:hypothetical protein